jgi:hypothetical protein
MLERQCLIVPTWVLAPVDGFFEMRDVGTQGW